ncbi:hypothetical protein BU23DRAFT_600432 [Bimuria novae-zelandiae CBS 107.79]|uniref:F-box domain-containing protein n=1 Tax=Bimuria novae-zelandiae CBS 107.79 TaxID=1447943 RepID=A0A6A5V505_9PLEO|nr:hypothetical protein BU23DRAFT_600432 [Bimuria novae-zelandiae CBS 107.79]
MLHLPAEIIDQTLQELQGSEKHGLASYATINKSWQTAVEAHIWKDVEVKFHEFNSFQEYCSSSGDASSDARRSEDGIDDDQEPANPDSEDKSQGWTDSEDGEGDYDSEDSDDITPLDEKISAARSEQERFYQEIATVWRELSRWAHDFQLQHIQVRIHGHSLYKLLGYLRQYEQDFLDDALLGPRVGPEIQQLSAITTFSLWADEQIDLWPALLACNLAHSFASLSNLNIDNADREKKYIITRCRFRKDLAERLAKLPQTLQPLALSLPYRGNINHEVEPCRMLHRGRDILSQALNRISVSLTTLTLKLNQISPDIFWNPACTQHNPTWPNLLTLTLETGFETGFETAFREYMLHGSNWELPRRKAYAAPLSVLRADITPAEEEDEEFGDFPFASFEAIPVGLC